jgi:hypothetical protein
MLKTNNWNKQGVIGIIDEQPEENDQNTFNNLSEGDI